MDAHHATPLRPLHHPSVVAQPSTHPHTFASYSESNLGISGAIKVMGRRQRREIAAKSDRSPRTSTNKRATHESRHESRHKLRCSHDDRASHDQPCGSRICRRIRRGSRVQGGRRAKHGRRRPHSRAASSRLRLLRRPEAVPFWNVAREGTDSALLLLEIARRRSTHVLRHALFPTSHLPTGADGSSDEPPRATCERKVCECKLRLYG